MTVDIKGESGGRVTEIALHGFDVITGADAVHGVGMTKIVYPCVGKANTFHNTLEAVEDCTIGNIASNSLVNTKPLSSHARPAAPSALAAVSSHTARV